MKGADALAPAPSVTYACTLGIHRSLGFGQVVHRPNDDFFSRVRDAKFLKKVDLIWDNPPYTSPETKEAVLRALVASGKPFAVLLPISVLHVRFVRELLDSSHVQVASLSLT